MWLSRFSLSLLPLALMSYISICLVSDKERVMIYAFPFVLLSVFGLRFNTKKERLLSLTPLFVYFCLNFVQDWWQFRFRIVFLIGLIIFVIIESFFLG
jgi:hypothetical protein